MALSPVNIFESGAEETKGEGARLTTFVGAIAVGDLVKTTLGPKGMDKILMSADGKVTVTNDGATILKSLYLDNPAAKVLVNISKTQDDEIGDGTTSVAVLASELLREAEKLVLQKIHPQSIITGYRIAQAAAQAALEAAALDHSADPTLFRQDMLNIARTTLSSKLLTKNRDMFAEMVVSACLRLRDHDLESIQIIKKHGGTLHDSYLDEGFILSKKIGVAQPKRMENARILLCNTPMDTDKVKIFSSKVKTSSPKVIADLELAEKQKMKAKVDKILAHGCNVFINRQLIYNYPEQLFANAGVLAIEHADFEGVERLAKVTGADVVSTFDNPSGVVMGKCDLIEEIMIGEDKVIRFSGVQLGQACTIVLRGATSHILDEAERSLHDALCVVSQHRKFPKIVFGGGASECLMAKAVEDVAATTSGKVSAAVLAFATALRALPTIIADNAGLDSMDLVSQLKAAHNTGKSTYGLDIRGRCIGDMQTIGITESLHAKMAVLTSASEAAEMILRVDDVIRCAPRARQGQ
jgi:T-complex protein 1 subunit beta